MNTNTTTIRRGDIFFAELPEVEGSVYHSFRPILIISNNMNNTHSKTITAIPMTSRLSKNHLPTHVYIEGRKNGLPKDSIIMAENISNYSVTILRKWIGSIPENSTEMRAIEKAVKIQIAVD